MWKMFAFTAVAGTLCAAPLELGMGMNGDVRVGDTGARLALAIHHAGWSGTSKGARRDFAFPDAATGTARFDFFTDREGVACAHGRTTLLAAADGCAVLDASVTSDRDQTPELVVLTLTMPCETFAGSAWKTSGGASGTFAKAWDGKSIGVWNGTAGWIEFAPP